MSWFQPESGDPFPLSTDLTRLLKDVEIRRVEFHDPAIENLLEELRRTHSNGGALFSMFALKSNPTLDWLIGHNQTGKAIDRLKLFEHDAVFEAFPELHQAPRVVQEPALEGVSDLTFAGELAHQLRLGGAYRSTQTLKARKLAEEFRACLIGERFDDLVVFRSPTPWNKWFWDIAWDETWFILDKQQMRFSLLLKTDTD